MKKMTPVEASTGLLEERFGPPLLEHEGRLSGAITPKAVEEIKREAREWGRLLKKKTRAVERLTSADVRTRVR